MLCVSQLELKYPVVCFRSLNILTASDCSQKFKYWTRNCHKSESFEDILLDEYITHVTNYSDRLGGRERRQYLFRWFDKAVSRWELLFKPSLNQWILSLKCSYLQQELKWKKRSGEHISYNFISSDNLKFTIGFTQYLPAYIYFLTVVLWFSEKPTSVF